MSKGGVLKLRCEKNDDVCCVDLFKRSFPDEGNGVGAATVSM